MSQQRLTYQDIVRFKRQHLVKFSGSQSLYEVTKEIKCFKKVVTYRIYNDSKISIQPELIGPRGLSNWLDSNSKNLFASIYDEPAIVNMIIPVGAKVHISDTKALQNPHHLKMRASEAKVHSIVRISDKRQVALGRSEHDRNFLYVNPKKLILNFDSSPNSTSEIIKPNGGFSMSGGECAGGIHFFINVDAALAYY